MTTLLLLFLNNILPILLVAGAGYLLGKVLNLDPKALSRVVFYVFAPCLLFNLITKSALEGADFLRMMSLAVILIALLGVLTYFLGKILRLERKLHIAVMLTVMFMNAGNYGLSLNYFAFGDAGLAFAGLFFAAQGILAYTLGVLIASLGAYDWKNAFLSIFKIPLVYALLLAVLVLSLDWQLPTPIERTVDILAQGSIPAMLILLGLQIRTVRWGSDVKPLVLANSLRLLVSPALAVVLSGLLGLQGAARQAGVLEAAMPTAVFTIVLASEYEVNPSFATMAVFSSTLLSPLTLTPLLALLGAANG